MSIKRKLRKEGNMVAKKKTAKKPTAKKTATKTTKKKAVAKKRTTKKTYGLVDSKGRKMKAKLVIG